MIQNMAVALESKYTSWHYGKVNPIFGYLKKEIVRKNFVSEFHNDTTAKVYFYLIQNGELLYTEQVQIPTSSHDEDVEKQLSKKIKSWQKIASKLPLKKGIDLRVLLQAIIYEVDNNTWKTPLVGVRQVTFGKNGFIFHPGIMCIFRQDKQDDRPEIIQSCMHQGFKEFNIPKEALPYIDPNLPSVENPVFIEFDNKTLSITWK